MSYLDNGFDEFLNRIDPSAAGQSQQLDPQTFENFTDSISGSKIQGGSLSSVDGKTKFDLENNTFRINDGTQDLITLGVLDDGSIGLLIKDAKGNTLMRISANDNYIQSSDGTFKIAINDSQILAFDANRNEIMLIGKLVGMF